MQDEIKELYEKIKDQLSEDEFLAEMEEAREGFGSEVPFVTDLDCAREVLKNHDIDISSGLSKSETSEEVPFEIPLENDEEESEITMTEDILKIYEKVQDKISKEDFIARMNEFKNRDNLGADFIVDDTPYAEMVAGELKDEEVETISERPEYAVDTIDKLEKNSRDVTVSGRVVSGIMVSFVAGGTVASGSGFCG